MDDEFTINTDYAEKYNKWREKEELQKLKDRYGDVEDLDSDSSSSESEDDDAEALTPQLERDWLRTLAAVKSRDPKIYDKSITFYHEKKEGSSSEEEVTKTKEKRPLYLKDYERKVILEKEGHLSDEEEEDVDDENKYGYFEEQDEIKQSFKDVLQDSDSESEEFLVKREKTKEELKREEDDYIQWLKGQKNDLSQDTAISKDLKPLKQFWGSSSLDEGEKFLRDYILNKQYIADDDSRIPTYEEIVEDEVDFSEEESILDKQEDFERKYNFRFEEADAEVVKSYPRSLGDLLRKKDSRRVKKREEYKERKQKEKDKKKEELKQLKNLKRKELFEKLEKLKTTSGNPDLDLDPEDLERDFDPEEHDRKMKEVFTDDYYGNDSEVTKPQFSDDEDLGLEENWDTWTGVTADEQEEFDSLNFNMDADAPSTSKDKFSSRGEKKRKKKSKFAQALQRPKPLFDPKEKNFEDYYNEYYKLDYEDIVAGMPCRFKYRNVVANDFGLSTDEVLKCRDKELNTWASLKKATQYRTEEEEYLDKKIYQKKAHQSRKKLNVLTSLREQEKEVQNNSHGNEPRVTIQTEVKSSNTNVEEEILQSKKRKRKNKAIKLDTQEEIQLDSKVISSTRRKKKHKNLNSNNFETQNSDSVTVKERTSSKKPTKLKKKKDRKTPALSEERLKAFGIDPKKFKYTKKKKLSQESH